MPDTSRSRLPRRERGKPLSLSSDDRAHHRSGELPDDAGDGAAAADPDGGSRRWLLTGIRYVLPVVVTICGVVIMAFGSETDLEGGASIVSAGLAIYFLNWLYRIGVSGDRERDTEEAAREYFAQHGRWPS